MKTITLIFICLIASANIAYSQVSNDERLEEIKIEINEAIEQSDFERAAALKRERDLRMEIKEAIENNDFARAAELKEQIENKPIPMKASPEPKVAETGSENNERKDANAEATPAQATQNPPTQLIWYPSRGGLYIDGSVGNIMVGSGFTRLNSIAGGARIGAKIYFGDNENRTRAGLDFMLVSLIGSDFGHDISIANTGFSLATAFTKHTGFEFGFVTGVQLFHDYFYDINFQSVVPGLTINPQFKFRFAFIDLGAHLVYSSAFGYDIRSLYVGAIAGFKFYKRQ